MRGEAAGGESFLPGNNAGVAFYERARSGRHIRSISKDNLHDVLQLKVAPHQEQFVASNAVSLAEAHFEPELPWFRAIYAGEVPVGFLMLEFNTAEQIYFLCRFMIDERYQGYGHGRQA
jgi:diamine N-acetyltransferase